MYLGILVLLFVCGTFADKSPEEQVAALIPGNTDSHKIMNEFLADCTDGCSVPTVDSHASVGASSKDSSGNWLWSINAGSSTCGCKDADWQGTKGRTTEQTVDEFNADILKAHNFYRAKHQDTDPLSQDKSLIAYAVSWAAVLQKNNAWCHSKICGSKYGFTANTSIGENLYYSTYSQGQTPLIHGWDAAESWYYEIDYYSYKDYTSHPSDIEIGHFTQLVWKNSKYVGCGRGINTNRFYISCNYAPPGNYVGQKNYDENVMPLKTENSEDNSEESSGNSDETSGNNSDNSEDNSENNSDNSEDNSETNSDNSENNSDNSEDNSENNSDNSENNSDNSEDNSENNSDNSEDNSENNSDNSEDNSENNSDNSEEGSGDSTDDKRDAIKAEIKAIVKELLAAAKPYMTKMTTIRNQYYQLYKQYYGMS